MRFNPGATCDPRCRPRGRSTHGTRVAADVARRVQMLTGMTGVFESSPLAAKVRDVQMITQHAFLGETTYQNAGAIFFGLASSPEYL